MTLNLNLQPDDHNLFSCIWYCGVVVKLSRRLLTRPDLKSTLCRLSSGTINWTDFGYWKVRVSKLDCPLSLTQSFSLCMTDIEINSGFFSIMPNLLEDISPYDKGIQGG